MAATDLFPWEKSAGGRKAGTLSRFLLAYADLQSGPSNIRWRATAEAHGLSPRWLKQYAYRWSNYLVTGDPEGVRPSSLERVNDDGRVKSEDDKRAAARFCDTDL